MPVTPARIRWRLIVAVEGDAVMPWQVAVDHVMSFKPNVQGDPASDVNFGNVYAPDTTQNNPNQRGIYHFWLERGFDTRRYADGRYVLQVEVSDVRGNPNIAGLVVTFTNSNSWSTRPASSR